MENEKAPLGDDTPSEANQENLYQLESNTSGDIESNLSESGSGDLSSVEVRRW